MDETASQIWYLRVGGVITSTASDVADLAPMLRANAYAKAVRGESLTDDEQAAVETGKDLPLIGSISGNLLGDVGLGFMFLQHPELVRELDDLIGKWSAAMSGHEPNPQDFMAWQLATDYAERALAVTMDEAGMGGDEESAARHLERSGETPERIAEIQAAWAKDKADFDAREASPEGQAAAAAAEIAMAPDDGPEGWSTVPPSNPDHPNSAANHRALMARHWRLVNEDRARRGEGPDPASEGKI